MSGKCATFFGTSSGGTTIPPTTLPTCYDIGACAFSEMSQLAVTLWNHEMQADCSVVSTSTVEYWAFDSRDASTFRWSDGAGSWAQYNADTNRWTYSADDPFDFTGAGVSCPTSLSGNTSEHSCERAAFYTVLAGQTTPLISWVVIKNSCSHNEIA